MRHINPDSLQKTYYERTAATYHDSHVEAGGSHAIALSAFQGMLSRLPHKSILDVGAGTGRAIKTLRQSYPNSHIAGVEPVAELREQGHAGGVAPNDLIDGNALNLPFADGEFEWVIATGVLHHVRDYRRAVREMCRVASFGVMISDSNNMGQGRPAVRLLKQVVKAVGLWPTLNLIQTRGKGFKYSPGDGVFYSFTAYDIVPTIRNKFPVVYYMNTDVCERSLYRSASHIMIIGQKERL